MSYIKINKDKLDYHQFADFHAFTMNNFIRSIMKNGKYKKATKIARLGLLQALRRIHYAFHHKYVFDVYKSFSRLKKTHLAEPTKERLNDQILSQIDELQDKQIELEELNKKETRDSILNDNTIIYYSKLSNKIKATNQINFSFFNYFNKLIDNPKFDEEFDNYFYDKIDQINKDKNTFDNQNIANNFKLQLQHNIFSQELQFQKIYTKIPEKWYFRTRNLTVFDMIIQAYTMLTGIWYMRKIKVSGRSVLVPSPLRPYRRISTVTQMLLKGIRKLRVESKEYKKAMINSIGSEFYFLVMYYGCQYKHPNITASYVWQLKLQSHKELVANLKNIKNLSYY